MTRHGSIVSLFLLLLLLCGGCDLSDVHGDAKFNMPDFDIRGVIFVSEVHWAGSVNNAGERSDPDDDYIEIRSIADGSIDIGGWSIVFTGTISHTFVFPAGTLLTASSRVAVGTHTNGAFSEHDFIDPNLRIPSSGWAVRIEDGGGRSSDSADFQERFWLPGGLSQPRFRRSMLRRTDAFQSGEEGDLYTSWFTYGEHSSTWSARRIRMDYRQSVYGAPGSW